MLRTDRSSGGTVKEKVNARRIHFGVLSSGGTVKEKVNARRIHFGVLSEQ